MELPLRATLPFLQLIWSKSINLCLQYQQLIS